ncbi:MAG: hypothetical protein RLZ16_953 [Bacteroidota bacterium]|jgi:uncharacterized membrane protein YbhN (UPF0104 family)
MFKKVIQIIINYGRKWFGFLLFIICAIAIYKEAISNKNWAAYGVEIQQQLLQTAFTYWLILLLLMGFNFAIEALKWKLLVEKNNPIGFLKSLRSVFVGQAFAFFTPNRIGEYIGRTMFLETVNKAKGLAQMAWTSYAQLLVTIIVGTVALFWNLPFFPWLKWASPLIALSAIIIFFYDRQWNGWLAVLNKLQIPTHSKITLLILSFLRYGVFTFQYAWAAKMLGMEIPFWVLGSSIAVLFLFLSILPTISITELVVRGQLLLLILAPWYSNGLMIIVLSSLIWAVNFLLPAIIGACLLLGFRLKQ